MVEPWPIFDERDIDSLEQGDIVDFGYGRGPASYTAVFLGSDDSLRMHFCSRENKSDEVIYEFNVKRKYLVPGNDGCLHIAPRSSYNYEMISPHTNYILFSLRDEDFRSIGL